MNEKLRTDAAPGVHDALLRLLTCPKGCAIDLQVAEAQAYTQFDISEELVCPSCNSRYPVVSGIPLVFADQDSILLSLDRQRQKALINEVEQIDGATASVGEYSKRDAHLGHPAQRQALALAWEYFLVPTISRQSQQEYESLLQFVERHEPSLNGKLILNAGCGLDPAFELFQRKGSIVIEQDIVLDVLLSLSSRGALGICCDLRHPPVKTGVFDIVISHKTLHHIWPVEEPIAEICRMLKPGGSFLATEPNDQSLAFRIKAALPPLLANLIWKAAKHGVRGSPFEKPIDPKHFVGSLRKTEFFSSIELSFSKTLGPSLGFEHIVRPLLMVFPSLSWAFKIYARKSLQGRNYE